MTDGMIRILPENLIGKIAAGEVVQRPSYAIKELIENSIDANSSAITVIVKEGGKKLIQVVDDGDGMSESDALMAFQRHATSKIRSYEDIENLKTLGFRGEALASIASVSQAELRTRTASDRVGTKITFDGSGGVKSEPESAGKGTSIQVKNLFYNTPGRRNFLKSNATEYRHIYDVVQRMALCYPAVDIKFVSDDETILNLKSASVQDRVRDIFGEKFSESLIYLDEKSDLLRVSGFVGKPSFSRKGRSEQFLYLNQRYIISRNLNYAVFQAYENLLVKGTYPVFILFLSIDPLKVDVNVHPSKMEVKFEDENAIHRFVLSAVRRILSASDLIPSIENRISEGEPNYHNALGSYKGKSFGLKTNYPEKFIDGLFLNSRTNEGQISAKIAPGAVGDEKHSAPGGHMHGSDRPDHLSRLLDGKAIQLDKKYILLVSAYEIIIVDQHASHERILYEKAVKRMKEPKGTSQQLLFPHPIQSTPGDVALIKQLISDLEPLGFQIKFFSNNTLILEGVPVDLKPGSEGSILQQILDAYKEDDYSVKIDPLERLAKSYACKAAIKSGDFLKESEIQALLNDLFECEIPYSCPHGRPTLIRLTIGELDRIFGRTS